MTIPATKPPMWAKKATPPAASAAVSAPSDANAVDELQHEPEPQHDHRADRDQLVEEAQEHERQDPCARIQDEVGAEGGGDRAGCPDQRQSRAGVDQQPASAAATIPPRR